MEGTTPKFDCMAHTLQQFRDDPTILQQYTHKQRVPCICGRCGEEHTKGKRVVQLAVKAAQEHLFCTRSCSSLRQRDGSWEAREGIDGRVCKRCNNWKPRSRLWNRRGWVCNTCAAKYPRSKFRGYKRRALKGNLAFVLSYEEFLAHWNKPCSYCEASIETIGLDRVDNTKGYSRANVQPCCPECNWMKGEGTQEEFLARCIRVAEKHLC